MRRPNPIRPRKAHARAYEAQLRARYLDPLHGIVRRQARQADSWRAALDAVDAVIATWDDAPPINAIANALRAVDVDHRDRFVRGFKRVYKVNLSPLLTRPLAQGRALGLDTEDVLSDPTISEFVRERIGDNVALIKTIPARYHAGLRRRILALTADAPFDQAALMKMLSTEYRSAGYNLRRLTRDQTSKMVGQLNEVRQRQVGVERYEWSTAEDERVRSEHASLNGRVFRWDKPPGEGNPGAAVQCRCVALPVVTPENVRTWRDAPLSVAPVPRRP